MVKIVFQPFVNARKIIHSLKLKSSNEWATYCKSDKKPKDIPTHPDRTYKNKGWISWPDFLNTKNIASQKIKFLSFTAARKYVHTLGLKTTTKWQQYSKSGKKPDNIPANPSQTYAKKGWKGMGDWLGNGSISPKDRSVVTYDECKKFVQKLGIKKQKDWEIYCKSGNRPNNIPTHPDRIYKKEWKGWGEFQGTNRVANKNILFWPYEKSSKHVHLQKFKNQVEFRAAAKDNKLPRGIPKSPMTVYKNKGWTSWPDFLNTDNVANQTLSKNYLQIDKARIESRLLAKKYNLKSHDDWIKAHQEGKIPKYLPRNPWQVYPKRTKK